MSYDGVAVNERFETLIILKEISNNETLLPIEYELNIFNNFDSTEDRTRDQPIIRPKR